MAGRLEGADDAAALRVVAGRAALAARAGRADLRLDHRRQVQVDHPGAEERVEAEDRRRRGAAGAGDEVGGLDLLAVQLRHAVDELAEQVGIRVLVAVPDRVVVRVVQPEVGAQVDDDLRLIAQLRQRLHADAVRQAEEEHVARLQRLARRVLQLRALSQVRVRGEDELARIAPRRRLLDLHLRVAQQNPQQLPARIPRRADDRDCGHPSSPCWYDLTPPPAGGTPLLAGEGKELSATSGNRYSCQPLAVPGVPTLSLQGEGRRRSGGEGWLGHATPAGCPRSDSTFRTR